MEEISSHWLGPERFLSHSEAVLICMKPASDFRGKPEVAFLGLSHVKPNPQIKNLWFIKVNLYVISSMTME